MQIFKLDKNTFEMLDFKVFYAIFELMIKCRHKLFDDEYFNAETPYIQRVYDIINVHLPYFWLFLDENTLKPQGFCYLYDINPSKNRIQSANATICFEKSAYGNAALETAKKLLAQLFGTYKIYKIKAECYSDNILIPNFLEKLGFQMEASLKNEVISRGALKNLDIWSIFNPLFCEAQ